MSGDVRRGRARLHAGHELLLVLEQRPVLDQLVQVPRSPGMCGPSRPCLPGVKANACRTGSTPSDRTTCPASPLAAGIDRDRDAVVAGLTLPWNSGVVEGQVNRIKRLKRQMLGRAGFDLQRKRVLLA